MRLTGSKNVSRAENRIELFYEYKWPVCPATLALPSQFILRCASDGVRVGVHRAARAGQRPRRRRVRPALPHLADRLREGARQ